MRCRAKIENGLSLVFRFPGPIDMFMRTPNANRQTSSGRLPGISEIALRASSDRQNEAGDPSRIRTCNPRSRNPLLYPVELWDRWRPYNIANMKNPLPGQARSEPFSASRRLSPGGWTVAFGRRPTQGCATAGFRPGRALASTDKGSLRHVLHATFSLPCFPAMSPSPFSALLFDTRRSSAQGAPS
jgi:hypothetical protein